MPRAAKSLVTLVPPLQVMQPVPARVLPRADGLPGGVQYSVKLDGIRAACFIGSGHEVTLHSRRGTVLNTRFLQLVGPLAELPVGLVLDGEIVAYKPTPGGGPGRIDFTSLLTTHEARVAGGVQVLYVVFDLLAEPGKDVRGLPLRDRWDMLSVALAGARPPLQQIMATTSRTEALAWYRDLEPLGIEGIVARGWDTPYTPGPATGWQKIRHTNTVDGALVGITGAVNRPDAVLVQLPDGRQEVTSPRLDGHQALKVAGAVAGRLRPADSGSARVHWVEEPWPLVEVVVGSGRHATVRFVRIRAEE